MMLDPRPILAHEPCRCLRWKGMFIQAERDPSVPPSNDHLFWCMHTQTCIGPDNHVAEPEHCTAERECYEH
ncbi:MAG: hypothetical protein HYX72_14575 [Acidobacteria bacterium]|nr:hypothetical protein [Acidobacteriota bacterium]